jgi:predicted RecA/RadA family phage recombinase
MRNKYSDGKHPKLNVGGALTSGSYTQVGALNCVLVDDADAAFDAVVALEGVYSLPVVAGGALAQGAKVYTPDGVVIDDNPAGDLVGHLFTAIGGAGTVTVPVRLTQV